MTQFKNLNYFQSSSCGQLFVLTLLISLCFSSNACSETGFTGVSFQGIDARAASALGLKNRKGVLVRDIALGEAANKAGMRRGDLIVKYAGHEIDSVEHLIKIAKNTDPGQTVEVVALRDGKQKRYKLKLTKRRDVWKVIKTETLSIPTVGLSLAAVTPKIRERFSLRWDSHGVLVTLIDPKFTKRTELKRGDLIVQVNQKIVWRPEHIEQALNQAKADQRDFLLLLIERRGMFKFFLLSTD